MALSALLQARKRRNRLAPDEPSSAATDTSPQDPRYSYDRMSILLHWSTVVAVALLTVLSGTWHASLGYLLAAPLLWRVARRFSHGFPRIADQPILFNFIERLTIAAMLVSLVLLAVTGCLMALLEGQPYAFFGLPIGQLPWSGNGIAASINRAIHDWSAFLLLIAFLVHMAAVIKHYVVPRHGVLERIMKPGEGGK